MSNELRTKTISSVAWNGLGQVAVQAMRLLVSIILIRLLSPEAFGLVGMVTVFVGFADVVRDLGFRAALIQKQDAEERHYASVFWVSLGFGLLLSLLFGALAPLIARFYGQPAITALTLAIAIRFSLDSLGLVQSSLLMKELRFKPLSLLETTAAALSGGVAIVMALTGFGVWSLIAQPLVLSAVTVIGLWIVSDWRPSWSFDWSAVRELLRFSMNLLGFSTLNYWTRNADNLLIGRYLGTTALGLYGRAYMVILYPIQQIAAVISRVMFPALATIQGDTRRIQRIYLRLTAAVALITFPLMLGLFVVAEDFVRALFGTQWLALVPMVRLFALVALVQSILTLNGNLYLSKGQTALQFKIGGLVGMAGIAAVIFGLQYGVNGVAYAYSVATLVLSYPSLRFAVGLVGLRVWDVVQNLLRIAVCTVLMGAGVFLVALTLPVNWSAFARLGIQVACGAGIYLLLIHLLRVDAYRELLGMAIQQWRNQRKGSTHV